MLEFALLPLLSPPQEPNAPPPAPLLEAAPLDLPYRPGPERWLPADCPLAIVLAELDDTGGELARSGLAHAWQTGAFDEARQLLRSIGSQLTVSTGLDETQIVDTLAAGLAIGWLGVTDDGQPDVVIVLDTERHADAFATCLRRWRGEQQESPWQCRFGVGDGFAATVGSRLVLATSAATVQATTRRLATADGDSLADDAAFVAQMKASAPAGHRLFTVHVRPHACLTALGELNGARPWLGALALALPDTAFASVLHGNGQIHGWSRLHCPDLHGLLAELVGTPRRLEADWSRFVAPDARSFLVTAVHPGRIVRAAVELGEQLVPGTAEQFANTLARLQARCGADLQRDLLDNLTEGVTIVGHDRDGTPGFSVRLQVADAARAARMLTAALPMSPLPIETFDCEGIRAWRLASDGPMQATFALAGDALLFAGDEQSLAAAIRQQLAPQPNPEAVDLLSSLPPGATWASVHDPRAELMAMGIAGPVDTAAPAGEGRSPLHPGRSIVVREESAVRIEQSSTLGGAWLLSALPHGLPTQWLGQHTEQGDPATMSTIKGSRNPALRDTVAPRAAAMLQAVADAQREHMTLAASDDDADDIAEFGSLRALHEQPALARVLAGSTWAGDDAVLEGWRLRVLLPATADQREHQFAAVVWPEGQTGRAWFLRADGAVFGSDELCATTRADVALEDLFPDGDPGSPPGSGWRRIDAQNLTLDAGTADPTDVAVLQAAEAAGKKLDAEGVARLLHADSPEVAARAAWLLGRHKVEPAVGALCDALGTRAEVDVRLQAMAALVAIGAPAARAAALDALDDSSRDVRALAARYLTRHRSTQTADALLGMLSQFGREQTDIKPVDLVAALLALHDFGDPAALLPAATAVAIEHAATGQALAFLFQQLSPKLAPKDEATTLVAVLDHADATLRRYAIQRLGELRDATTATALERRLATEGPGLQPLVKVSLAQIRGGIETDDGDLLERARKNGAAIGELVTTRWQKLEPTAQWTILGLGGVAVVGLFLLLFARRRADRGPDAADVAAGLVAPSDPAIDGDTVMTAAANMDATATPDPVDEQDMVGTAAGDDEDKRA
ncbi:MAG: HEAT repeat domain-containing protein [Planctomycetes bacterium]|nr:HEAT repeat domain-containing protein [Planctomycetota bacterium]